MISLYYLAKQYKLRPSYIFLNLGKRRIAARGKAGFICFHLIKKELSAPPPKNYIFRPRKTSPDAEYDSHLDLMMTSISLIIERNNRLEDDSVTS